MSSAQHDYCPRIVVAMLTYRRTSGLAQGIEAVLGQVRGFPQAMLLIVDNDPAGSARDVVEAFSGPEVQYVNETKPGIAAARNRAMDETGAGYLLVFIDDDEVPSTGWLRALVEMHHRERPAAVVGAVVSEFEVMPDAWIVAGRFFERRRLVSGTQVDVAATNNLLLDLDQVRSLNLRFDERFGESGGSDTLFTRQLAKAGRVLVWCDEAVVVDTVPVTRITHRWVIHRAFRSGNSWVRTDLALMDATPARTGVRLRALAVGSVRIAVGMTKVLIGRLTGSLGRRVTGLRTMARGAGMAAGAVGFTYHEYRRSRHPVLSLSTEGVS